MEPPAVHCREMPIYPWLDIRLSCKFFSVYKHLKLENCETQQLNLIGFFPALSNTQILRMGDGRLYFG